MSMPKKIYFFEKSKSLHNKIFTPEFSLSIYAKMDRIAEGWLNGCDFAVSRYRGFSGFAVSMGLSPFLGFYGFAVSEFQSLNAFGVSEFNFVEGFAVLCLRRF